MSAKPSNESSRQQANGAESATKAASKKHRVLIVDDHAMFREGLRQLIDREEDLMVCGDVGCAEEALQGIKKLRPDLVIVDISLSGSSGIDLIKTINNDCEDLPVLVVSMHDESLYAERALRAGAMGYVMKQEPAKTVKKAIRKVLHGEMHLSERMAGSVISRFMRNVDDLPPSPLEKLSDRELEVFQMLGLGKGVRQIAAEMNVTIATVNSFRNRIKEKLQLKSSTEVMLHAFQWSREGDPK